MELRPLLLSLLLTLTGCNGTKLFFYEPPDSSVVFKGTTPERMPRRELLKKTIDDVALSGLLDPMMVDDFNKVVYTLKLKDGKILGSYIPWKYSIEFYVPPAEYLQSRFSDDAYSQLQQTLFRTALHELAHYFWERRLPDDKKDHFRARAQYYCQSAEKIFRQANGRAITESMCAAFGMTPESYFNIMKFLSTKNFYRKRFRNDFEKNFYGTEAFAYLAIGQLEGLLRHVPLPAQHFPHQHSPTQNPAASPPGLWGLNKLPDDLQDCYKRFLHDNFFLSGKGKSSP